MRRQQIIETVTCDKCGEGTDEPTSWSVEIGRTPSNGRPLRRIVDLCPAHAPLVAELHELLRHVPSTPAAHPSSTDALDRHVEQCPVCGDTVPDAYMSSHIVRKHGASVPQPPHCPDCDAPPHKDSSSLMAHRRSMHGYDHRAALLASLDASPKRKRSR